jgi:hypothetical protein
MNTYKYSNGVLESIEIPTEWVQTGNYAWYCGLPSEMAVPSTAEGFNIAVYRASSKQAPYQFVGFVGFNYKYYDKEIHFPQLEDLIHYVNKHVRLLYLTLLARIVDQFDSKDSLFHDLSCLPGGQWQDMTKGDNK